MLNLWLKWLTFICSGCSKIEYKIGYFEKFKSCISVIVKNDTIILESFNVWYNKNAINIVSRLSNENLTKMSDITN